ncbi:MAG: hypothetical protein GF408_01885 [Candidatus Omnitrophica bacterium]|nr:hypothetical protein [Candidatus Omnitrophota bacterium]
MKRMLGVLAVLLVGAVAISGCGQPKAESSSAAIKEAGTMDTAQEKSEYLIGQAKAFMASDEFQNAVDVLQYVLSTVDRDNPQARQLLEQAKEELSAQAKSAAEDLKASFGG